MYRIPKELDLSPIIGSFSTQLRVGQFDLQFSFGSVSFMIQSPITLKRHDEVIGIWEEGRWPDFAFYDIMNVCVSRYAIPDDTRVIIYFENGIEMHLIDSSVQYESMIISTNDGEDQWII